MSWKHRYPLTRRRLPPPTPALENVIPDVALVRGPVELSLDQLRCPSDTGVGVSCADQGIMERGTAIRDGEVIGECHRRPSSSSMYGPPLSPSFISAITLARRESPACRLMSSGASLRSCDICCTIGRHGCAWPDHINNTGVGSGGGIGNVDSDVGDWGGGCGVGTSKVDGSGVGPGGADDDGEGSVHKVNVGGAGSRGSGSIGNDCGNAGGPVVNDSVPTSGVGGNGADHGGSAEDKDLACGSMSTALAPEVVAVSAMDMRVTGLTMWTTLAPEAVAASATLTAMQAVRS